MGVRVEDQQKKTACVDFDGVLNTYTHWRGEDDLYEPRPGAREFLEKLGEKFKVVIFSTRRPKAIELWLREHDLWRYVADVTNRKVMAVVYIDDRAVGFNGNYEETLAQVDGFKPWYHRAQTNPG